MIPVSETFRKAPLFGNTCLSTPLLSAGIYTVAKMPREKWYFFQSLAWTVWFFFFFPYFECFIRGCRLRKEATLHPFSQIVYKMKEKAPSLPPALSEDDASCDAVEQHMPALLLSPMTTCRILFSGKSSVADAA